MLIDKDWHGADVVEVIRKEMAPYSGRIAIHGPTVLLGAKPAQNFALAVHELATNAAKYGALSNATGLVRITWRVDDSRTALNFRWEESAGPRVVVPVRKGFGSVVLEQVMADYCDNQPKVEFHDRGVTYDVTCLLAAIAPTSPAGGSDAATSDAS